MNRSYGRRCCRARNAGELCYLLRALSLLALLIVCSGLAACQPTTALVGSAASRQKLTIAWVHKTLGNPVFDLGQRGALQKAAELSAQGPIEVEVIAAGPISADAVAQMQLIEDLIARNVDAIAVSCNDPVACIDPINKAVAAGIPVMTWDSDAPDSRRFTYLSIDNYQAGRAAADLLVRAMGAQGKVAILTGVPGAWNLEERIRGFQAKIATYPGIQVVAVVASNEDISLGVQRVEETMQKYPDLNGWFFAGMWPLFAERNSMPLWEDAARNRGLKTVSFDTLPQELDLLRDGYLTGLVGQKYWSWGYDSVQIVYDHIVHSKTFPPFIDSGMDIVTPRNVEPMIHAWETNDFSQPLPPPFQEFRWEPTVVR